MSRVVEWIGGVLGIDSATAGKLILSVSIVIALWVIHWVWVRIIYRKTDKADVRYRWRKGLTYATTIAGLVLIGRVWFEGIQTLVTYLGLLSAGIILALRDPLVNAIGWAYIGWRRPFTIGDRVRIGELTGDVIDIGGSTFSLLEVGGPEHGEQPTGRIVHIPNGKVFVEPLSNITQGFSYVWNQIPITVTFESDWENAKDLLLGIAREQMETVATEAQQWIQDATRRFLIRTPDVAPNVYTRIVGDGVELTIRYLCDARRTRATEQAMSEAILKAFAEEPRIDFAYRTSRLFRQTEEGKPALRVSALPPPELLM